MTLDAPVNEMWWYTVFREKIRSASDEELPQLIEKLYRDFLIKDKGFQPDEKGIPLVKNVASSTITITDIPNTYRFIRFLMYPHLGSATVLELGCGASPFPYILVTDGCNVCAVDFRQNVIDNQRKFIPLLPAELQKNIRFDCALAEKLPYSNSYFDIIVGVDFVEHVRDLDRLMKECVRVLKQDGKMFFSTPILGLSWSPDHLHNFTEDNIKTLFDKYGFRVKIYKERYYWSRLKPNTFIIEALK